MSKDLGDDQLGSVELPDDNCLAVIVGTADQTQVDDLLSMARSEGLISLEINGYATITRQGWKQLERIDPVVASAMETPSITPPIASQKIVKAYCNDCKGERNAFIRAEYNSFDSDESVSWSNNYKILQCCGCDGVSVRREHWFSEWDTIGQDDFGKPRLEPGVQTTYWPPPMRRPKPGWSDTISDQVLGTVFDEIYTALSSDLVVLPTIGARTLFDRASYLQVGDVGGGFKGRLDAMLKAGHVSSTEMEILAIMTDAGHASAHRGFAPTFKQLMAIMDILENYIHRTQVLGDAANVIKSATPARK